MSEAIRCDRCGRWEEKLDTANSEGGASAIGPPDWETVGEYDFCHDCALWFFQFLNGNNVPELPDIAPEQGSEEGEGDA